MCVFLHICSNCATFIFQTAPNFEKFTASPEALGTLLASLTVINSPWEEAFHKTICPDCGRPDCDNCQHEAKRNNPTWWLNQTAEAVETVHRAVWRNSREEVEKGLEMLVALNIPLRVHIRASAYERPFGEIPDGENAGTEFERAWKTVEEVKKVYPNAEISIELEV